MTHCKMLEVKVGVHVFCFVILHNHINLYNIILSGFGSSVYNVHLVSEKSFISMSKGSTQWVMAPTCTRLVNLSQT